MSYWPTTFKAVTQFSPGPVLLKAGNDLLSRVLRRSTIGAKGLYGRVRNGIACAPLAESPAYEKTGMDCFLQKQKKNNPQGGEYLFFGDCCTGILENLEKRAGLNANQANGPISTG